MSGARALTRLLVALIENLGYQDKLGGRQGMRQEPRAGTPAPGWPHGTSRTAFGPTPLGAEIEKLMGASAAPQPAGPAAARPLAPPRSTAPAPAGQEPDMQRRAADGDRAAPPPPAAPPLPRADGAPPAPAPLSPAPKTSLHTAPPGTVGFARGQVRPPAPKPAPVVEPMPEPTAAAPPAKPAEPEIPVWQRPFIATPGVRYMRTPDHMLRRTREHDAPIVPIVPPAVEPRTEQPPSEETAQDEAIDTDETSWIEEILDGLASNDSETDVTEEDDLHIENEAVSGSHRGLPRRLKMTSGFRVDVPMPANDPRLPLAIEPAPLPFLAPKPSFNVTVRPKMLRTPTPPVAEPVAGPAAEPIEPLAELATAPSRVALAAKPPQKAKRKAAPVIEWVYPSAELLGEMVKPEGNTLTADMLEQNARLLESTLEDFGIRGEIIHVRAGPVVTLYELEPAPGMKSSRVIGLADDIARSMSAVSARVAVVPGRNAIGIELPNERRETVFFREMIESEAFVSSPNKLAIALGKTIGGEPVIAELAKMPHLLVAGTTGSGKSVAINTMILSLLYRLKPEECRLIMVDPKMLELSIYDGIPHLLTPVVTDPKKAVVALKWAVREMEDRYKKMSKMGVRNIDGFNRRVSEAKAAGEQIMLPVTTGFEKETGKPVIEEQPLDLVPLPYIVVIVDEMADLMMVAGKDIEGAIQRLAQMARAAGIHLIMATQRPSVDVITGTIKANFPTRISFQVTSKIDSRTILGEMGAEQLLGQGDMLHMQGGGRIYRVHGPFVADEDVERVVAHLKAQRAPEYVDSVTDDLEADEAEGDEDGDDDGAVFDKTAMGEEDGDLYDQAVKIVLRDKKSSISYVQRRLQVGYNKAASLIERMEKDGILSPASHTGKREILAPSRTRVITGVPMGYEED